MTKLYLSTAIDSTTSNLPSTEQSTLASAADLTTQSTHRVMYTGKGVVASDIGASVSLTVATKNVYVGKWIYILDNTVTSISANTWTYYACTGTNNSIAKFAMDAAKKAYINLYVWRPGTGKIGTVFDGLTNASTTAQGNFQQINVHTFSGSAVNSLQTGDVLILEVWAQTTASTAASYPCVYMIGGSDDTYAEGTTSPATPAPYISTPQTLPSNGNPPQVKLYLHDATSALSNLPTSEQSTLTTFQQNVDAQNINRVMDTTIGTSQVSKVINIDDSTTAFNYYVTRFVSPMLAAQVIPAAIWTYSFAAAESATSVNYPDPPLHICFYLWRPGTGKVADILIGNSSSGFAEVNATAAERSMMGTFSGASVTAQQGDVLCFEVIFQIDPTSGTSRTATYYYDGTTETLSTNGAVSNHASMLLAALNIDFNALRNLNQTITHSLTLTSDHTRLKNLNRSMTHSLTLVSNHTRLRGLLQLFTESLSFVSTHTRLRGKWRTIAESLGLVSAHSRITNHLRTITHSLTLISSHTRLKTILPRTITHSLALTSTHTRLRGLIQTVQHDLVLLENSLQTRAGVKIIVHSLTFVSDHIRITTRVRTITHALAFVSDHTRLRGLVQLITHTLTLVSSHTRSRGLNRSASHSITFVSDHVEIRGKWKTVSHSLTLTSTHSRLTTRIRTILHSLAFTSGHTRIRGLIQTISHSLAFTSDHVRLRGLIQTITHSLAFTSDHARIRLLVQTVSHSLAFVSNHIVGATRYFYIRRLRIRSNKGNV